MFLKLLYEVESFLNVNSLSLPPLRALFEPCDWPTQKMLSSDWLQNFQYNQTDPGHGRLLYIRKARLSTVLNLSKQVLFVCLD